MSAIAADLPGARPGLVRLGAAVAVSLALNAAVLVGLGALGDPGEAPAVQASPRVPLTIASPPPPPPPEPEPEPEPELAEPLMAAAPVPPLELPPTSDAAGGLALPKADAASFDWALGLDLPNYAPKGGALGDTAKSAYEPPQMLFSPDLSRYYPRRAQRLGVSGETTVRVHIDTRGRVAEVEVLDSAPPGVFEQSAVRAAKEIRYRPATRDGRPQTATAKLKLTWRPQ